MSDDRSKYDALIESKSWDSLTEEELAELRLAGIGRKEYDSIRSALHGFDNISDVDKGLIMRPEVRDNLMEMFDKEYPPDTEETDPQVIRIRRIRVRFLAAAAAAAIVLVSSLWWIALKDDNVKQLLPEVELARHTEKTPDVEPDHEIAAETLSDAVMPFAGHEQGGDASEMEREEITEAGDKGSIEGSEKATTAGEDYQPAIADALFTENRVSEKEFTEEKAMEIPLKKITVDAYSNQAANMAVTTNISVTRSKAVAESYGKQSKGAATGRPLSEDADLLRFLYACK